MSINCIAIDDEPLALDIIRNFASKIPFLNLMAVFENPLESIDFMKKKQVDLIFLDIQMDDINGIQFLKLLNNRPYVIFTTAYEDYALTGYELEAIDYLLKPIFFERFVKAADRVYRKMMPANEGEKEMTRHQEANHEDFIFVKTGFHHQRIRYRDILYIKGEGDYLRIVTHQKKIMTLLSFRNLQELLPADEFVRVHKSYVVAIRHIDSIERNRIKVGDEVISVSGTYSKNFFGLLKSKKLIT
ncbi:DNA-binding response regulator [Prolixibacter bellariivorans]|uniref:DNA-binding response regulator n=1 Tax=Prolixibacter bellariivorans TaxID=314319 RepID=A0A5M4B4C1_9BACT|nr:LytTR family DNA-binding domain-containing protein [Prolixibacter bellariivorans]GET34964.1 DNA-binding response regulator [Prolixibacter bellariivorans]